MESLVLRLSRRYTRALATTPRGRAMLLTHCAEAENSGENRLFDRLADRVNDPDLHRLIQRHQADELRHARLFEACAERTGVPLRPVPENLRIIDRLDVRLGGVFERPIVSDLEVMEAYLLLQVLEERAVTQFPLFEQAFAGIDPETAAVFAEVARDEARHLKYCHAISRRYAPDEALRVATLRRFREAEAEAFATNSRATMAYSLGNGLVDVSVLERLAWRGVGALSDLLSQRQPTPFWSEGVAVPS
jgi:rubrerythrin